VGSILILSLIFATTLICVGVIATAIYPRTPSALVIALLVALALRIVISLFQTVSRWLRRRARLRRMRRL
jgi:hypothetical protein